MRTLGLGPSLKVEFEAMSKSPWFSCTGQREHSQHCLLSLGSDCQGPQEDHSEPGTPKGSRLELKVEGTDAHGTVQAGRGCLLPVGWSIHFICSPRNSRMLLETVGFLIPVHLTLGAHSNIL